MVEESYDTACRLCLNSNSKNINVFENNSYADIINTISSSLSIQIAQNDGLPTVICTVCIEKIVSWDSFKKLCTESQEQLHQWLEKRQQRQFEEESNPISTFSRLETSIHIKEEFIEEDFDDNFEYTYETFTPDFSIKIEPGVGNTSYKSIRSKKKVSPKKDFPPRVPFNYKLVIEMYKDRVCKFCSKTFHRNSNLVQHLRLFHMIVPFNTCFHCGQTSKTNLEAKSHRAMCRKQSLKNNEYPTQVTVKDDKSMGPLEITEKNCESTPSDASEYKFSCGLCGKLFKTMEEWTLHRATHVVKINDGISSFDVVIDEKIILGINNSETSLNQSFSEVSDQTNTHSFTDWLSLDNNEKIQNIHSENDLSEPTEKSVDLIESIPQTDKKSRPRRKFSSRSKSKFNFVSNSGVEFYKCDCGRTFNRIQAYQSHRKSHLRKQRRELMIRQSSNKKNTSEVKNVEIERQDDDKFACKGCDKSFTLPSKFRFHKKFCSSFQKLISVKNQTESEYINLNKPQTSKVERINDDTVKKSEKKVDNDKVKLISSKYKCTFCKQVIVSKSTYYKHQMSCSKRPTDYNKFLKFHPAGVKCGKCGKCYVNKTSFCRHRSFCPNAILIDTEMETKGDSLRCDLCKRICQSPGGLTEHRKRCHYALTSSCIECKQVFDSFLNFRLHYKQSHDRKALRLNQKLMRLENVPQHHFNVPMSNKDLKAWSCKRCKKNFVTLKGYNYHMKNKHEKTYGIHTCNTCDKNFYHTSTLQKHMTVCQSNATPITHDPTVVTQNASESPSSAAPCAVCNMSFETISELREHILIKHKPAFIQERKKKTYFCQFCKMAFDRHLDLKQHFNEYHADNIKTDYPSPPILKAERPDTSERNNVTCSSCQLSFDTQAELEMHVSTFHSVEM